MGTRLAVAHGQWGLKDFSLLCPSLLTKQEDLTQQIFNLVYHLKVSVHDAYSMPQSMRSELWAAFLKQKEFEEKNKKT